MRKNKLVGRRGRSLDDDKLKGGRDDLDAAIGVHTNLNCFEKKSSKTTNLGDHSITNHF